MSNVNGLKMAICQMSVVPGRPDLNIDYMAEETIKAAERKIDIIAFPELCTTGYFIGDQFEDESFISDVTELHKKIREATKSGIAVIFGTVIPDKKKMGENGFFRLFNAAVVYQNGEYIGRAIKTLLPSYRMFDDPRHFYSALKLAAEMNIPINKFLQPITIKTKSGRTIKLGVTLCEDIWDENYSISPVGILTGNGAELICNLSASPWTWQKNRKRHEVVRNLAHCETPIVYVNNTGVQNIGKNIIVFDGCSTIYNKNGLPICEVEAHSNGTFDFLYDEQTPELLQPIKDDSKELFLATESGINGFFSNIPPDKRKIVVGLSGGIDSAASAALYAHVLGKENVIGINMSMPDSNPILQEAAREEAKNLGISYEIIPIGDIVELKAKKLNVEIGSLTYENLQARTRMDILATRAQQLGGFFSSNFNKVEQAFGYGTLGGDMEGCLAILGDMVKREVYELADYMNREIYKKQVIPEASFREAPTADLKIGQKDPFDYGNISRRGYHDEMVRAFTDFRRNPEWFIELYTADKLEGELLLEPETLKRLFPTSLHFVKDLEKHWGMFHGSYFKRIQAPPQLIVSRRSFGGDLRESMIPAYLTARYKKLRAALLTDPKSKIVVDGGSFNPPSLHHCEIADGLRSRFEKVYVVPCGPREDKESANEISLLDRKELAKKAFGQIPGVLVDYWDLKNNYHSPAYLLDEVYKERNPSKEVWHVIGGDLIVGGARGESQIQKSWKRGDWVWKNLNFVVIVRPEIDFSIDDLPPNAIILEMDSLFGSGSMIRERIDKDLEVENLLLPEVWEYIKEKELYGYKKKTDDK